MIARKLREKIHTAGQWSFSARKPRGTKTRRTFSQEEVMSQ